MTLYFPREVIARCLASVEDYPDPEDWSVADDVILALTNAGYVIVLRERARGG